MMTIEELSAAVHEPAVVERFSHLVREAAGASDGRVLKQIGDEFMLVFPSSTQATACGSSIMAKAAGEDQFPDVRLGAHAGHALYRDGDYLGGTVNVAARVASQAVRGQFLVTDLIRQEIAAESGITFSRLAVVSSESGSRPLSEVREGGSQPAACFGGRFSEVDTRVGRAVGRGQREIDSGAVKAFSPRGRRVGIAAEGSRRCEEIVGMLLVQALNRIVVMYLTH